MKPTMRSNGSIKQTPTAPIWYDAILIIWQTHNLLERHKGITITQMLLRFLMETAVQLKGWKRETADTSQRLEQKLEKGMQKYEISHNNFLTQTGILYIKKTNEI